VEAIIRESQKQNDPVTGYYSPPQPQHQQHQYQHQHQYQQPEPEPDNRQPLRDHRWYVPDEPVRYSRNGGPGSWLKIVASVAGAVITGVAFGFFVLSMFTTDSDPAKLQQNGVAAGTVTTPSAADKKDAAAGSAAAPDKAAAVNAGEAAGTVAAASAAVQIPAKTYTFLQSGVFSTQQGADTAGADLKRQGFAAAADAGEKFPVYAAMTLNRDDALLLGQQFASKKIEVIMKTVELPQVTKAKWTGKQPEQLQAYMANGDKLVQLIAGQSVKHLTESKSTPLDASSMDAVKTTHQAWAAMASAVNDGLSAEAKLAQQKMNSAMNTAVMSLDEYKKNPSAALMWQAQTSLMQYTLADKNLRLATAVQ
jgi:stage II sporulation protein B